MAKYHKMINRINDLTIGGKIMSTTIRIEKGMTTVRIYGLFLSVVIAPLNLKRRGRKEKPKPFKIPPYLIQANNKREAVDKFLSSDAYNYFKRGFEAGKIEPKITKQDLRKRLRLISSTPIKKDSVAFIIS